ncbi:MAG TPA: arylamine N-acetyltransferase [Thermomicrobiales bacterium]|nr:arylamine N-acetyltransferase [Thermomicrobiales bacterium]
MTTVNIDAYLSRIGYTGSTTPTLDTLRELHRAHLLAVPFENLDIHLGRDIVLDESRLVEKIVGERRGGFCYELNGAFAALLRALGFRVSLLSAGVTTPDGMIGPDFDHMLLLVDLDEPWLADVGFGDCFVEPIRLADEVQHDRGRSFQVLDNDEERILQRRDDAGEWSAQYRFHLTPHTLIDFAGMCQYHQSSPDSHFTRNRVCSRLTPTGRISLTNNRLIVTEDGQRHETVVANDAAFANALRRNFGIDLPPTDSCLNE